MSEPQYLAGIRIAERTRMDFVLTDVIIALYSFNLLIWLATGVVRALSYRRRPWTLWLVKSAPRPNRGSLWRINHVALFVLLAPIVISFKLAYTIKEGRRQLHPESSAPLCWAALCYALSSALTCILLWCWMSGLVQSANECYMAFMALSRSIPDSTKPHRSSAVPSWLQNAWLAGIPFLFVTPMLVLGALSSVQTERMVDAIRATGDLLLSADPADPSELQRLSLTALHFHTIAMHQNIATACLYLAFSLISLVTFGTGAVYLLHKFRSMPTGLQSRICKPSFHDRRFDWQIPANAAGAPVDSIRMQLYRQTRIDLRIGLAFVALWTVYLIGCVLVYIVLAVQAPAGDVTRAAQWIFRGDGFGCNGLFLLIGGGLLYQSSRDLHAANRDLRAAQANARSSHPLELSFPDGTQKEEREKVWGVSDYDSITTQRCLLPVLAGDPTVVLDESDGDSQA